MRHLQIARPAPGIPKHVLAWFRESASTWPRPQQRPWGPLDCRSVSDWNSRADFAPQATRLAEADDSSDRVRDSLIPPVPVPQRLRRKWAKRGGLLHGVIQHLAALSFRGYSKIRSSSPAIGMNAGAADRDYPTSEVSRISQGLGSPAASPVPNPSFPDDRCAPCWTRINGALYDERYSPFRAAALLGTNHPAPLRLWSMQPCSTCDDIFNAPDPVSASDPFPGSSLASLWYRCASGQGSIWGVLAAAREGVGRLAGLSILSVRTTPSAH